MPEPNPITPLASQPGVQVEASRYPVLIEALSLGNRSGLGKLTALYLEALSRVLTGGQVVLLVRRDPGRLLPPNWKIVRVRARPYRPWIALAFPLRLVLTGARTVVCMGWTLPPVRPRAVYHLVVADAGVLETSDLRHSKYPAANRRTLLKNLARAHRIWTISAFSKGRLLKLAGQAEDKIEVLRPIPGPVGVDGANREEPAHFPPEPFILAVGNLEPKKNFPCLVRAHTLCSGRVAGFPVLAIAGEAAWGSAEIERTLREAGAVGRVHLLGYVDEARKLRLLSRCCYFVSPSLYEGWGFPLFEALQRGTPALYHTGTAQDEFARGFAVAADCSRPESLAKAMIELWSDAGGRNRLKQALRREFAATHRSGLVSDLALALNKY